MENLIEQFKEDKNLRKTLYIALSIIGYVTVTLLINPMILVVTLLIGCGIMLIVFRFSLGDRCSLVLKGFRANVWIPQEGFVYLRRK